MKTAQQLAQDAIFVQDAVNLCAIAISYARLMEALLNAPESTGTDWTNHHPLAVLFASKCASLTMLGGGDPAVFNHAYNWVADTAEGKRPNDFNYERIR